MDLLIAEDLPSVADLPIVEIHLAASPPITTVPVSVAAQKIALPNPGVDPIVQKEAQTALLKLGVLQIALQEVQIDQLKLGVDQTVRQRAQNAHGVDQIDLLKALIKIGALRIEVAIKSATEMPALQIAQTQNAVLPVLAMARKNQRHAVAQVISPAVETSALRRSYKISYLRDHQRGLQASLGYGGNFL